MAGFVSYGASGYKKGWGGTGSEGGGQIAESIVTAGEIGADLWF